MSCRVGGSDALDDGGDAHAAADAERGQAVALVAALELVDQGAEDHRAGRAERVAHGDRAAVDVDLLRGRGPCRCMKRSTTAANASLISNRSMSSTVEAGLGERLAGGRARGR